ncbi:exonuclease domain-containing protein [Corynebacterium mendelii]|uniref:3'-5' exonuclease n=1 Tax=Corynebacterium mendelii TaxID=2765362 RepID=A0A939E322_9CORY|nr:exonuclease domain-containing protein [Corynebacterium mendelii]MBN9644622.1 3'-5' exonuclease [Corynebacterium mendelii]
MFGLDKLSRTKKKATGALADFYTATFPDGHTPLDQLKLLAVDVETTGLEPGTHRLLSIGWVPVNATSIDLSGAGHVIVKGSEGAASVGHSATVHGLTDDAVAAGTDPAEAVAMVLEALKGRAMLTHYAPMEQGFLGQACKTHFGADLIVPIVDTFACERRHMEKMATYPRGEDLRLARVRSRYNLPAYSNHNALTDAIACAELYLALATNVRGGTLKSMQPYG